MLEYPELFTIAKQMETVLVGKTVTEGALVKRNGNLFMDEDADKKYPLLAGGKVTAIDFCAPEIYIRLDNGFGILFCQCGGKILYHEPGEPMPASHTIHFMFDDGSSLSYSMLLWSLGVYAITLDEWSARRNSNGENKFQPLNHQTFNEFMSFIGRNTEQEKMPIKVFLSKYMAGIMSTFAAEILLYAKVYPSVPLGKLTAGQQEHIFEAMQTVLSMACEKGGRTTECNLYGQKGGYMAMTERKNIGKECPLCGNPLTKNSTGGVTAFCPVCQIKRHPEI